ncbi:FAD-dependent oxidoreductase [Candidatus Bipolaricaulota bacterium]|nr:FAD-dependent oxidoreductase [Candidatus Bipolaricaulota bacterium]
MKERDVLLVGAGPAGMFGGSKFIGEDLDVTILERGKPPKERESITYGVGGAGAFSDGKLNLTPEIGGDPTTFNRQGSELEPYIDEIDRIFADFGGGSTYSGESKSGLQELKKKAGKYGIEFIPGKQRHIGTKKIREVIDNFYQHLLEHGVEVELEAKVEEISYDKGKYTLTTDQEEYVAPYVIAAPGRSGAYWLREVANSLGIQTKYGPIDVGIRVEFPAEIYQPIEEVMYDAKFRLRTETYDDMVRTFCTNPRGFVVKEPYEDFTLINGHAENSNESEVTNFALLSRITLTDPIEDTTEYGRSIAKLANTLGGGEPILQRLKDLKDGRRSTDKRIGRVPYKPTLSEHTPGDISMALPDRVTVNLTEGLERLNNIIEGVTSDNTLLYAPEIKFYDTKYDVSRDLETDMDGFYVAGDASGHSRGIVYSAITGMIAAEGIKTRLTDET